MILRIKGIRTYDDLYLVCLFFWEFLVIVMHSNLMTLLGTPISGAYMIVRILTFCICIFLFIKSAGRKNNYYQFVYGIALLLAASLSFYFSGHDDLFVVTLFIIGGAANDLKKNVKVLRNALILALVIVVSASLLGIIDGMITISVRDSAEITRLALGFYHANTLALFLMQLMLMTIYINYESIKKYHIILAIVFGGVCYQMTASRTSLICTVVAVVLIYFYKFIENRKAYKIMLSITKKLLVILLVLVSVGTVYVVINYNTGNVLSDFVAETLGVRIQLLNDALKLYSFTPFGQDVNLVSSSEYNLYRGSGVVLDNSYMYMLLVYGVVPTITLMIGYLWGLGEMNKQKDSCIMICTIAYFIMGITEKYFSSLYYNFTLLIIIATIYGSLTRKRGKENG